MNSKFITKPFIDIEGSNLVSDTISFEHNTIQTRVTNQLRKLILTNELAVGERIKQDELATQLGVSRTPVREAIRQLESEGLVKILPYKGAEVTGSSLEELEGVYQIRIALEAHATRLACRNINSEDIATLKENVHEMRKTFVESDPEKSLEINRDFYQYLFGLCGEPQLYQLAMSYLDKANRYRQQYFYHDEFSESTLLMHEELIGFLEQQPLAVEKIVAFTSRHLQQSLVRLKNALLEKEMPN